MGIWPGHRGYIPTLYEKGHGIFNDHRESGPRFNVSSERQMGACPLVRVSLTTPTRGKAAVSLNCLPLQLI